MNDEKFLFVFVGVLWLLIALLASMGSIGEHILGFGGLLWMLAILLSWIYERHQNFRLWLTERAGQCMVIKGQPIYANHSTLARMIARMNADPSERAPATLELHDLYDRGGRQYKAVKHWLAQQYASDASAFWNEWGSFHFSGKEARFELHGLMLAWAYFTGHGVARKTGVSSDDRDSIFAGIDASSEIVIAGTLLEFTVETKTGSVLRANRKGLSLIAR